MKSLLIELRRRNVFRVAATYAVVAWVMAQGANVILPAFEAPEWVLKVVIALLLLGFPIMVILTWAYELTPEGLRRTPAEGEEARNGRSARLIDSVMVIALVLTVITVTAMNLGGLAGGHGAGRGDEPATRAAGATTHHVAVMPLIGVDTDPATGFLARGLTDDLIHRLRRFNGIDLVGAASSFSYVENKATLEDVGKHLGVTQVIQGSVRSSDGQIAVNVQLVSVPEGKELWSLAEQRPAAELLAVLRAVVSGLARQLELQGPPEVAAADGTSAAETAGYADWLRLLGRLRAGGPDNIQQARVIAQRLTAESPKFGEGFAALAYAGFAAAELSGAADFSDAVSQSRALLDQALTLSPQSERVLEWRARVESRMVRWRGRREDYERVAAEFRHALELFPGRPSLITAFAGHCAAFAEHAHAIDLARSALDRDPRSSEAHALLIRSLLAMGRHDAAAEAAATMQQVLPNSATVRHLLAEVAGARGKLDAALDHYRQVPGPGTETLRALARLHASRKDTGAALEALSQWPDDGTDTLERDIWRIALEKDAAKAFALAEEGLALHTRDTALFGRLGVQTGHFDKAVNYFGRYFSEWVNDSGPLLGEAAWTNAPWFAYALKQSGRDEESRRLLDRHLAGLVLMEGRLAPSERALYLAANYAVQKRDSDAIAALEHAVGHGFRLSWSALGAPIALEDVVLLDSLSANPGYTRLLSRLQDENGAPVRAEPAKTGSS